VTLGAIPESKLPEAAIRSLDSAVSVLEANFAVPAYSMAVAVPGKGLWQRGKTPAEAPLLFWASVGKTFTAVVILQLAEEGKLALDDTISRWVEGVPNGGIATVRDLLAHTGGIFSANEDRKARAAHRYHGLAENLAIARRHGAMFCPGERWRYSNTGYEVLGEIIRKADGRPFEAAIAARILAPLGLDSLRALTPGGGSPGVAPLVSSREKPIDPSWAGAAAPIAGTAADMARFWAALFQGRLLPLERVREMSATLHPMFDPGTFYGLGMAAFEVPDRNPRDTLRWIGHAGGTPGASSIAIYSLADGALVTVAVTGEVPAMPIANLLLKALAR
jgi:D-alanyl-D-alanine carboxypeptidase